jgi:N-acetylglutamate synthase-like GNAT family acetyltransferase
MEVSIRLATTADLETIIDLQTRSMSNLPAHFRKYDLKQIDSLIFGQTALRRIYFSMETTLVAENENGLVGFASLAVSFQTKISGLFVHPDFITKGIGSKLLRQLELIATQNQIKTLIVMSSLESVDFYQKNGYQFRRETGFYSQGLVWIPCQLFEKELIPSTHTERLATQTVKIVLSVVFLAIISTIAHKADKKPTCCSTINCRVCPQMIVPEPKY